MISFLISAVKIIFLLGFLITIHETGHFLIAKLCKVKVNEFAIGFGPKIWNKQGKETKYVLRLIPLGGFVSMEGEEGPSDKEGSFSNASIPKRIAIVVAGASVNIIFGFLVYFILMFSMGNNVSLVVDSTIEGYAAEQAGLQANDEIVKINGSDVRIKSDIARIINQTEADEITITVKRNEQLQDIKLTPTKEETNGITTYLIGIYFKKAENNFGNNMYYAFWQTGDFAGSIVDSMKMLFTGKVGVDQMTGPVGISEVVVKTTSFQEFAYILALVSVSLGVTNLLPIPALDGGKLLLLIIEAVRRKKLKEKTEINIQLVGFTLLIILSIYVTCNDIVKLF